MNCVQIEPLPRLYVSEYFGNWYLKLNRVDVCFFFCLAFPGRGKQREPFLCFLDMYESLRSTVWISFFSMFYNWSNCTVFLHSFYPWNIVIDRKTALKINHCVESFWFPRYSHWIALFRLRKWGFQYSVELSKSREYFTTAPTSTILRAN